MEIYVPFGKAMMRVTLEFSFLATNGVEYVIFKRRLSTIDVARVAGRDTLDGVKRQIDAFDLTSLMGT